MRRGFAAADAAVPAADGLRRAICENLPPTGCPHGHLIRRFTVCLQRSMFVSWQN
jgi:hypothetical protein